MVQTVNVQYSYRQTNEAYVIFKFVEDAKRVWEGGNDGLDGNMIHGNTNMDGSGEDISFVKMGIKRYQVKGGSFYKLHCLQYKYKEEQ